MTKFNSKSVKIVATLTALLPMAAMAQDGAPSPITSPGQIVNVIETVSGWFFQVFLALAVAFLIWAAFMYLTAAGNETKVESAKKALMYSIVAIVVALIAGGVTKIIENVIKGGSGNGF